MIQDTTVTTYYAKVKPTLGDRQRVIWQALNEREDWTNSELASHLDWPINTVTPRVKELRDIGIVEAAGKRLCRVTGLKVNAWRVRCIPIEPAFTNPGPFIPRVEVERRKLLAQSKLF